MISLFAIHYPALSYNYQNSQIQDNYSSLLDSAENILTTQPKEALNIAENLIEYDSFRADTTLWIRSLYVIHYVYAQYGNFEKALSYTLEQEKLAKKQNDLPTLIRVLENLAYDYSNLNSIEEAQKYRDKAISYARENGIKNPDSVSMIRIRVFIF